MILFIYFIIVCVYIYICICITFFALTLCYILLSFSFYILYMVFIHLIVHVVGNFQREKILLTFVGVHSSTKIKNMLRKGCDQFCLEGALLHLHAS